MYHNVYQAEDGRAWVCKAGHATEDDALLLDQSLPRYGIRRVGLFKLLPDPKRANDAITELVLTTLV